MLIVDAQIHLWNAGNPTNPNHRQIPAYLKDEALAEMEAAGVDAAVLTPHTPWDPNANELAVEAARQHPDRVVILGSHVLREARAVRRETMSQALEGIGVIDFTHDQAGPSCTQMLAWLGADVIKIERPPHGDRARRLWATPDDPADSYFFLLLNSNKRSIVVDLKMAEGKDIARRLVREADVVAENLGPGVMERLGLGYEEVKVLNPRAVYASVKGFGSYGPYSAYKCFEPVAQATSGAMSVTGEAGEAQLRSAADVSMVQATDFADWHNVSERRRLDGPPVRRILGEGEMGASVVVVLEVRGEDVLASDPR